MRMTCNRSRERFFVRELGEELMTVEVVSIRKIWMYVR